MSNKKFGPGGLWKPGQGWWSRKSRALAASALCLIWLGLLVAAGCTSDDANLTGAILVESTIDVTLDTLGVREVDQYVGKNVADASVPLLKHELLYMGTEGGNSSALLVNFNFDDAYSDSIPEEAYTLSNIAWVELQMIMPSVYMGGSEDDTTINGKIYEVHQLDTPFDGSQYPGDIPAYDPTDLNIEPGLDISGEPQIEISVPFFLNWVNTGGDQGLLIQEGFGSEPGFVAFSSLENHHVSQFPPLGVGTTLSPVLRVQFVEQDTIVSFPPYADISTYHELETAPADISDGFMVRTGLRTYPIIRFNLDELPENAIINRAVLYAVNDTSTSFGNLEALVISEYDMDFFGVPGDTLPLADLSSYTYTISGMTSLDPTYNDVLQFNVTQAIQRMVNSVYEGDKGFIMTAGESIFPNYNITAVNPDFYFTQFNFFGTAADDTLRPHIRVTYSTVDELSGEGQQ